MMFITTGDLGPSISSRPAGTSLGWERVFSSKEESFLQSLQDIDVRVVLLSAFCMLVYSLTHLLTEIWERKIVLNIHSPCGGCEELGESF